MHRQYKLCATKKEKVHRAKKERQQPERNKQNTERLAPEQQNKDIFIIVVPPFGTFLKSPIFLRHSSVSC